jgi:Zn-finger domain-containing protein
MKRIYGIFVIALLILIPVTGCGSDGSSVLNKQIEATEKYISGMGNAKSADDVVKTIDNFTEDMKVLLPELLEFEKKYPGYREGKAYEELEADVKKMEEVSAKMSEAMSNMMKYMMDPKVQEAMTRMGEEMSKLEE